MQWSYHAKIVYGKNISRERTFEIIDPTDLDFLRVRFTTRIKQNTYIESLNLKIGEHGCSVGKERTIHTFMVSKDFMYFDLK